ncbi:MAG: hypothetical protein Tsb0018_06950 [Opitutales bacterium]
MGIFKHARLVSSSLFGSLSKKLSICYLEWGLLRLGLADWDSFAQSINFCISQEKMDKDDKKN